MNAAAKKMDQNEVNLHRNRVENNIIAFKY